MTAYRIEDGQPGIAAVKRFTEALLGFPQADFGPFAFGDVAQKRR